jgi:small basic protein (TIGR04137 family)
MVDVERGAATIPALKKEQVMSRHASLKVSALTTANRSVLKRQERIAQLGVERRWKDGDDVTGLPKTKVHGKVKAKKA